MLLCSLLAAKHLQHLFSTSDVLWQSVRERERKTERERERGKERRKRGWKDGGVKAVNRLIKSVGGGRGDEGETEGKKQRRKARAWRREGMVKYRRPCSL